MAEPLLHILQINTKDAGGGADHVAWALHQGSLSKGHKSWIYVGKKNRDDPSVLAGDNDRYRNNRAKAMIAFGNIVSPLDRRIPGWWRLHEFLTYGIGQTRRWVDILKGYEDFDFPATHRILNLIPERPDIIHCHNLHGGYFDLNDLPSLSRQVPLLFTLHDAWLLSGHCAHSFDCERWKNGCGSCPDLGIYPPVRRDETARNWQRKKEIFERSRFFCTTPCHWLMGKANQSILASAILDERVIPYGVDLRTFKPDHKRDIREPLGLPLDSRIVLFAANSLHNSPWKDQKMMKECLQRIQQGMGEKKVLFLALGEEAPRKRIGPEQIHFIPFQSEPERVARVYQASDVYLHPALADTFPNMVIESLACGVPVVATAVGGIPEQINDGESGFLVPPHDSGAMAKAAITLLRDDTLRERCAHDAAHDAKKRFDAARMVEDYLRWYQEILSETERQQEETHAIA